jgi:hypothetical protein
VEKVRMDQYCKMCGESKNGSVPQNGVKHIRTVLFLSKITVRLFPLKVILYTMKPGLHFLRDCPKQM